MSGRQVLSESCALSVPNRLTYLLAFDNMAQRDKAWAGFRADPERVKAFAETDCGYVVPYLDVEAFADKTATLLESPSLRREMGEQAREKARQRHDISVIAPKILDVIGRFYER